MLSGLRFVAGLHLIPSKGPKQTAEYPDQTDKRIVPITYTGGVAAPLTECSTGLAKQYCCRREIKDS